jgi:hypothetical protein
LAFTVAAEAEPASVATAAAARTYFIVSSPLDWFPSAAATKP